MQQNDNNTDLNQFADEYLNPNLARTVDQKILLMLIDRVVPLLNNGSRALEMGYGDGAWTGALIERFGQSHIVDVSTELLKTAKSLYGDKIVNYHAYFEDFQPPILFDCVLCTYVLEHVVNPVLVLRQVKSWLKPEGHLFVAVPNATSLHRRLGVVMGIQHDVHQLGESDVSLGHYRVYDAAKLEDHLITAGFRIEESLPMMFKPLPNALMAHLSDAQLKGCFDLGDTLPEDQRSILAYFCQPLG